MQQTLHSWPRFKVEILTIGQAACTATLYATGRPIACTAPTLDAIRAGVIARCAKVATQFGRPVALEVVEPAGIYQLAVHASGIVQQVEIGQQIPDPTDLVPATGACRHCGAILQVTVSSCTQCANAHPLRIEIYSSTPPPQAAQQPHETLDSVSPAAVETAHIAPGEPLAVPARSIVVHFTDTGETLTVAAPAALGRKPTYEGHTPVVLPSPGRMVSRTHALVDVDERGNLLVIDNQSANGIEVDGRTLSPTTPTIVASGSRLKLGDVTLRIEAAPSRVTNSEENLAPNGVSPL